MGEWSSRAPPDLRGTDLRARGFAWDRSSGDRLRVFEGPTFKRPPPSGLAFKGRGFGVPHVIGKRSATARMDAKPRP